MCNAKLCFYLDAPEWLLAFQATPNNWSGVCLNPKTPFNLELRQKIQDHTMSVIDFRNYLFARQSALLLISSKPAEVFNFLFFYYLLIFLFSLFFSCGISFLS